MNGSKNGLIVIVVVVLGLLFYFLVLRNAEPASLKTFPKHIYDAHWKTAPNNEQIGDHDGKDAPFQQPEHILETLANSLYHEDYENAFSLFDLHAISSYLSSPKYHEKVTAWGLRMTKRGHLKRMDLLSYQGQAAYRVRFTFDDGSSSTTTIQLTSNQEIVTSPDELLQQLHL